MEAIKKLIEDGRAVMGIEFGSTRIKAVLINEEHEPIAEGSYEWSNKFVDGVWTYDLSDIETGLQTCYKSLKDDVSSKYSIGLKKLAAIGISGMMHGYLAFDKDDNLLVPFRTWRNTITGQAADALTDLFDFNVPQRWSISHLYQAILNGEPHVPSVSYITTLAGLIHYRLTGKRVMGVGEASGMFPIDDKTCDFDASMIEKFDKLVADKGYPWKIKEVLPEVLCSGSDAGTLTAEGAKFIDPSGELEAGAPLCPPEGDAGTGMVATNAVAPRTGNVSCGTSFFAMVVLEKALKKVHKELDIVTTPDGKPVAMAHCNNGTTDINGWVNLFKEYEEAKGNTPNVGEIFSLLFNKAMEGAKDCGGLLSYNYNAGEAITGLNEGRPLFVRTPDADFSLANFMRTHLYASLATLKIGCDILFKDEGAVVDVLYGHGGFFKTKGVGQTMLAAAMNCPVAVMKTAGEGGPWGMAVLAEYMLKGKGVSLSSYLSDKVFKDDDGTVIKPDAADVKGFDEYTDKYRKALPVQEAAAKNF